MPLIQPARGRTTALLAGWALLAAGCHEYVNPWQDETAAPELVTTASVTAARSHAVDDRVATRQTEPITMSPQDGTVVHFPLWFEDPFDNRGSADGQFAWTYEDYVGAPYGLARFILNGIALPVSAAVQPPVPCMASDGVLSKQALGYDHDAEWRPGNASSVPPDVLEVGAM